MSQNNFDFIPVFEDLNCIAGFTLKNPTYRQTNSSIAGLNLGLNQLEKHDIVHLHRGNFFSSIGISPKQISSLRQIHSTKVIYVQEPGVQDGEADALITDKTDLCLLIQTADCAPLLIIDIKNKNRIAAIHAGWRGAVGGIVQRTLSMMCDLGSEINDLRIAIGPCIGVQKFEVGDEVAMHFPEKYINRNIGYKAHINLRQFLIDIVVNQGIKSTNIENIDVCTVSNVEQCYSHRRERENAGRMGAFIQSLDC